MDTAALRDSPVQESRHEALMYSGESGFLSELVPFVRAGVGAGEPVMAAVSKRKIRLLREQLGAAARGVEFYDMAELGRNPARIIPAWQRFLDGVEGRPARGIGEPVWAGRSGAELAECRLHEHLLNDVLEATFGFWLVCPYDVAALDPNVAVQARNSHPTLCIDGSRVESTDYRNVDALSGDDLGLPPPAVLGGRFESSRLHWLRRVIAREARRAGLPGPAVEDITLAASEIAANSIRHGGGSGELRIWQEHGSFVCQLTDGGRINDPLVGRRWPSPDQADGRGLWIANQVCDLVQIRAGENGTTVRLQKRLASRQTSDDR